MITWISRPRTQRSLAAGALLLALAGCETPGGAGGTNAAGLTSARLARGAVTLVPPAGFCVDKRSLRTSFAIMARCDTLGGTATYGAPLAVITAATVASATSAAAGGAQNETILSRRQLQTVTLLRVKGKPPSPDMRDEFWRAVGLVGDQVIGLAIYEPAGGAGLGELAPELLNQAMHRTRVQTEAAAAARQDNSATTVAKPGTN